MFARSCVSTSGRLLPTSAHHNKFNVYVVDVLVNVTIINDEPPSQRRRLNGD